MIGKKFIKPFARIINPIRSFCVSKLNLHEMLEKKFSVGLNKELGISLVSVRDKGVTMEVEHSNNLSSH
jgi:hypothetical protein